MTRTRATKSEMATRRRRIYEIVERDQPMTVRQVYYQAVVHGIVGKAEEDYDKVQDMLTELRRDGRSRTNGSSTRDALLDSPTQSKASRRRSTTPAAVIAKIHGKVSTSTSRYGSKRMPSSACSNRSPANMMSR